MRYVLSVFVILVFLLTGAAVLAQESGEAPDSPLVARTKAHLKTFNDKRDKAENDAYCATALALADTLEAEGELVLVTECLERVGILHYYAGEIDEAIVIWERGLVAARRSGVTKRIGALLNTKAIGISASGDNVKALEVLNDLLEFRREHDDLRGEGTTWHNMAYSQLALFRIPEAVESLRNAIRIHREVDNFHGLATSYQSLAPWLEQYLRIDEALAIADSAVVTSEKIDHPQFLGTSLNARADMLHREGREQEALADLDRSLAVLEEAGATRFVGGPLNNRVDVLISLGRVEEIGQDAERALALLTEHGEAAHPLIARATMGRALLHRQEYEKARLSLQKTLVDFRAMQDTLDSEVSQANANYAGAVVTYLSFAHSRQGNDAEAWNVVEQNQARILRSDLAAGEPSVTLARYREVLEDREAAALVFGMATVEGCPAFLVSADGIVSFEIEIKGEVRRAQAEVLDILASGRESARLEEQLRLLGDNLIAPVAAEIPSGVRRLVIVPGSFASLPFEPLPLSEGTALGDRFAVSYTPSATAFVELERRSVQGEGFFAMADPVVGPLPETGLWAERLRGEGSVPLPEARIEVANIAPPGGNALVGDQATATAFLESAGSAAVVHLATHAIVDPANPGISALVLTSEGGADPVVLASEIQDLDLGSDLICLSSCSTAGGYQVPGEGTFGLTRSFLQAGSRTVVSSWWDVEDAASRRFMELFYAGLRNGLDRDVAAQEARVVMAQEGFNRRDRLAFAVVGAVSGSLTDVLGKENGSGKVSRILMIVMALALVLWWIAGRRGRASS